VLKTAQASPRDSRADAWAVLSTVSRLSSSFFKSSDLPPFVALAVFVLLRACFALFVFQPLTYAADLNNLPALARRALEPVTVDWPHEIARLEEWTGLVPDPVLLTRPDWSGGLPEVGLSSLWGTYFIEAAKSGRLKADELSRVMTEHKWTAADVAAFWDRLDRETADRARQPDVAGQVLAAIEQTPHLKDAFGDQASVEALFGLAQVKLFARKLPEARAALEAVLARLPEKTEAGHASRGVAAYRIAQSYEFAADFEHAREWYLKCAEWGTPENTGGYDVRSEGLGEAARMCRRLGRDEEAQAHYRKAIDQCGQWGQAVASMDLCGLLVRGNRPDEAIALLEPLAAGRNGPVAAVHALLTIARLRRDQGDAVAARDCATEALEVMAAVTEPQALAMLASSEGEARAMLCVLDRWDRQPVVVHPTRLTLRPRADRAPPCAHFTVSTMAASKVTIAAPEWLAVKPAGDVVRDGNGTHEPLLASLTPGAVAAAQHGEVAVGVEGHPAWRVLLPVEVLARALVVTPPEVFLGFIEAGDTRRTTIAVEDTDGKAFALLRALPEGEGVAVDPPTRARQSEWRIAVTVIGRRPGILRGRIVLETDLPGTETIEVPVYAHVVK